MKTLKFILLSVAALLCFGSCSGQSNNQNQNKMKAIVIFFSHAGDNYSVGNIAVGNTKIVADYITEFTGAEQFEIVTEDGIEH